MGFVKVEESHKGRRIEFTVSIGKMQKSFLRKIKYSTYASKRNGFTYLMLYDTDMNPIRDVFKYINYSCGKLSVNTRKQKLFSIKKLMEYADIFGLKIDKIEPPDITRFEYFLSGISAESESYDFYLDVKRSPKTIETIMKNCSLYCKYKHYKNYDIFKCSKHTKMQVTNFKKTCPPYITFEDYNRVIEYFEESNEMSEECRIKFVCMCRIMYEAGLRMGEMLGLTLEDVVFESKENGSTYCGLIIRNRTSDSFNQKAKTVAEVISKKEYKTEHYWTPKVGYQTVPITEDLYNMIFEYVDLSRERFHDLGMNLQKCKADCVTEEGFDNEYIFLNERVASPQNHTILNDTVKKAFIECGITEENLKTNTCHKFRHGAIMHWLYDLKLPSEVVKDISRHSTVNGLEPYITPDHKYLIDRMNELSDFIDNDGKGDDKSNG